MVVDGGVRTWRVFVFFFNDTATTEIYTLSLHDALPNLGSHRARLSEASAGLAPRDAAAARNCECRQNHHPDRKSTRLNSSHSQQSRMPSSA